jgi:hypothetical protein
VIQHILDEHLTARRGKVTLASSMFQLAAARGDQKRRTLDANSGAESDDDDDDESNSEDGGGNEEEDDDEGEDGGEDDTSESSVEGEGEGEGAGSSNGSDSGESSGTSATNSEERARAGSSAEIIHKVVGLYTGPAEWLPLVVPAFDPRGTRSPQLVEPHFGTEYWRDALPESVFLYWESCLEAGAEEEAAAAADEAAPAHGFVTELLLKKGELHLPLPNPYIPVDLAMIPTEPSCCGEETLPADPAIATESASSLRFPQKYLFFRDGTCTGDGPAAGLCGGTSESISADRAAAAVASLWHLPDTSFNSPKSEIVIRLLSPLPIKDARSAMMLDILYGMLKELLNEELYMASMADLSCEISTSDSWLSFRVSGYSEKGCLLAATAVRTFVDARSRWAPSACGAQRNDDGEGDGEAGTLRRVKEKLLLSYRNYNLKASRCASNHRLLALKAYAVPSAEKVTILARDVELGASTGSSSSSSGGGGGDGGAVTLQSLSAYVEEFVSSMSVEFFVHGNVHTDKAKHLVREVLACLPTNCNGIGGGAGRTRPDSSIVRIPARSATVLRCVPENSLETNCCVEAYFQLGPWNLLDQTKLDLLEQLLQEPFFDSLRTKQQVSQLLCLPFVSMNSFFIFSIFFLLYVSYHCSAARI